MMNDSIGVFFDHSRHKLTVRNLPLALDVLAFEGEERLSQPFHYRVEFTSVERDIGAERRRASTASASCWKTLRRSSRRWAARKIRRMIRCASGPIPAWVFLPVS